MVRAARDIAARRAAAGTFRQAAGNPEHSTSGYGTSKHDTADCDATGFGTTAPNLTGAGTAIRPQHADGASRKACRAAFIFTAAIAAGCVSPHGALVTDVDATAWKTPAVITLANADTTSLRDMELFLRHDDRFTEDTLTVRIAVITPDSLRYEEPFLLVIPPAHAPAALSREADIPYRRRIRFARAGDYRISITPGRPTKGIEAVGINIVKSE